MAEVFAPFPIQRTMCNLTFYMIEGRNFVRTKSSLTRRKVLYSAQFERTRHYAGLMGKASKIGSQVYNALPAYWRQGWMYRSFTGEAYTMLKARKKEGEIQQILWQRYVAIVVSKQREETITVPVNSQPKRAYRKLNSAYWERKTKKSIRRKALKQQLMHNAGILARASKIGSRLYAHIPVKYKCRSYYQQLTSWAMRLLKEQWDEADILPALLQSVRKEPPEKLQQSTPQKYTAGLVVHPDGQYHFIAAPSKRFDRQEVDALLVQTCKIQIKKNAHHGLT